MAITLVGCVVGPEVRNPKQLAEVQWAECSGQFDSVELVEISDDGKIYYREKHASTPTTAYQRCLARVAHAQVFAGERPAIDIVRRAHFSSGRPATGTLSELNRDTPPRVERYASSSLARFHYSIEATDRPVSVKLEWFDNLGVRAVQRRLVGPTPDRFLGSYRTHSLLLGEGIGAGQFIGVRLIIGERIAGEYVAIVDSP
ncbi:MAG: hypothetical protein HOK98_00845 [Rhodospirillaceae bacterium]|nr:hypothetical protein [Rhodospirillaceae bacterium]MBT5943646.1 hypothetical protein [Rhodospirillaceae bacterium]MBT6404833.1 hypothetical protein [Rhodospirillaceae bacterium]MBT6534700.1 hypothetical protein [Rhodospirillaceae bacterium]MBT7363081.1 hypothetical protein [Rhodospirillaceae bacterium]